MPLTAKGKTILTRMQAEYGKKKGTGVFYGAINNGRISGAERPARRPPRNAK